MIKIRCKSCLEEWEVMDGVNTTLICQKCGSGFLEFDSAVEMTCINGHIVIGKEAASNCDHCPIAQRSPLRKLVIIADESLDYIKMRRKTDLEKFIVDNGLEAHVGKLTAKMTLESIKIKIATALQDSGDVKPEETEPEEVPEEEATPQIKKRGGKRAKK